MFDQEAGKIFGSVTGPEQLGAFTSVNTIFSRSSSPVFVTLILNTAHEPTRTV
jgi:hypothetical protein